MKGIPPFGSTWGPIKTSQDFALYPPTGGLDLFGFGIEAQFENLTPGPWESVDPVHKII